MGPYAGRLVDHCDSSSRTRDTAAPQRITHLLHTRSAGARVVKSVTSQFTGFMMVYHFLLVSLAGLDQKNSRSVCRLPEYIGPVSRAGQAGAVNSKDCVSSSNHRSYGFQ